jgi:hypothetical protein
VFDVLLNVVSLQIINSSYKVSDSSLLKHSQHSCFFICSSTSYIYRRISTNLHPIPCTAILFGEKDLREQWSTKDDVCRKDHYSHKKETKKCQKRKNSHAAADFIMTLLCTLACQQSSCFHTHHFMHCYQYYTHLYAKANITEWHKQQQHSVTCD